MNLKCYLFVLFILVNKIAGIYGKGEFIIILWIILNVVKIVSVEGSGVD